MPTLQSAGIGSGLDVNGIVTQLVAAERAPKQSQITKQQTEVAVRISAMGSLKGALGAFQASLASLKTADDLVGRTGKSGDEKVFTVAAGPTAVAGTYGIKVSNLATAQQLSSDAFVTGGTEVVGNGLLKVSLGTKSFTVNVVQNSNDTLAGIRDSINQASDNVGVRAAIVQATDGAHLVLTSGSTGAANAIKLEASEGNGGLARLSYAPGNVDNYIELKEAKDALIKIAGYSRTSSSNTISDVIDGVTLTLIKESPDTEISVDIAVNVDATVSRINNFVAGYNSLAGTLGSLQSFDAATKRAGPLLGDSLARSIESDVRSGLTRPIESATGTYNSLSAIGITTKKDGTLEVDSTKLRAALDRDLGSVASLFSSSEGLASRLDAVIAPRLASTGDIANRNKTLDQRTKALGQDQVVLEKRIALIQQRYLKQFSSLDTLLSQMQSTSSYLSQQLAKLG